MKMAKCIMELERIYVIKKRGDRKSNQDYLDLKTQEDLASEMGINEKQIQEYKKLTTLIPELQQMVENKKGQLAYLTSYPNTVLYIYYYLGEIIML